MITGIPFDSRLVHIFAIFIFFFSFNSVTSPNKKETINYFIKIITVDLHSFIIQRSDYCKGIMFGMNDISGKLVF